MLAGNKTVLAPNTGHANTRIAAVHKFTNCAQHALLLHSRYFIIVSQLHVVFYVKANKSCTVGAVLHSILILEKPNFFCEDLRVEEMFITIISLISSLSFADASSSAHLLVVGGSCSSTLKDVDSFAVETGERSPVAFLKTPRYAHSAVTVDGLVYALGGYLFEGSPALDTVDVYDPNLNAWSPTTPMSMPRAVLGACELENKLYAIGGENGVEPQRSAEVFDPSTGEWKPTASMASRRYGHSVGVLSGRIYAIGGYDGHEYLNGGEKYDSTADYWSPIAAMQNNRAWFSASVLGHKLYAIGGFFDGKPLGSVEVYDSDTGEWGPVANLLLSRYGAGAASINGLIYVVGGMKGDMSCLQSIEVFDPTTKAWSISSDMRLYVPRSHLGVAALDLEKNDNLTISAANSSSAESSELTRIYVLLIAIAVFDCLMTSV
ncbi:unnamed protein product [Sphagnum balticum]